MCVYTVITNGFSSFHCSCTILKSRGQRCPCHFLCQRSWVTCGKDIDQGRLIYVPAVVSTVDFLFLFVSCALFLRSRIWVRWNSTARQLRKSGEDYDIIHTFYWPLPHSVCVLAKFKIGAWYPAIRWVRYAWYAWYAWYGRVGTLCIGTSMTPPLIWYGTVVRFIGTVGKVGTVGKRTKRTLLSVPTVPTNRTNRTNRTYQGKHISQPYRTIYSWNLAKPSSTYLESS